MSLTPSVPSPEEPSQPHYTEPSPLPRWVAVLFVVAFALVGYLVYANVSGQQATKRSLDSAEKKTQALAQEMDKANARIADLKGELDVTSQKLNLSEDELARARSLAQTIRKQQQQSDAALRQEIGQVQQDTSTKFGQVATDLNATKTDLSSTKADLEATKGKLQSTIGDLGVQSGLIARNHDEVEELRQLGQRDIYEFALGKTKSPQHVGPIQIQLRKTDPKHYRYTLNVVADDKSIEKKDRTVGEPIQFYVRGARAPYEIVVFEVSKNQAKGYLSTPKSASAPPPTASAPGNQ
ncbi:MAG TPA: hypothetical protein VMH00_13320 [Candidatus Limnocylindrales bacterium]|nr:hypothetical protein [Candidatus Limnocylindrales bacterium]